MSEAQPIDNRKIMAEAAAQAISKDPANYFSTLPLMTGVVAGIVGSFGIIAIITILALIAGFDPFLSPRFIASVVLRDAAWATGAGGTFAIAVGTVMHIMAGAFYGAVFARAMPKMPRGFWFVAGLIFGIVIWGIAAVALPFLAPANEIAPIVYTNAQIISHLIFGITLGIAGSFFGNISQS